MNSVLALSPLLLGGDLDCEGDLDRRLHTTAPRQAAQQWVCVLYSTIILYRSGEVYLSNVPSHPAGNVSFIISFHRI